MIFQIYYKILEKTNVKELIYGKAATLCKYLYTFRYLYLFERIFYRHGCSTIKLRTTVPTSILYQF